MLSKAGDETDRIESMQPAGVSDKVRSEIAEQINRITTSRIISAERHVAKLFSKYREFANSGDPASALKKTSLQGKTLGERVYGGVNFSPFSIVPIGFDITPQVGYKFNKKFYTGISLRYRFAAGDSIDRRPNLSSAKLAYSVFLSFTLRRSLFAYAESEMGRTSPGKDDRKAASWRMNYSAGIGRRFLVHPKLYFNVLMLYNFMGGNSSPVHLERFQCRIGVSMSELAIRKKVIHFNPNR
jgi:hypothetical protein